MTLKTHLTKAPSKHFFNTLFLKNNYLISYAILEVQNYIYYICYFYTYFLIHTRIILLDGDKNEENRKVYNYFIIIKKIIIFIDF